MTFLARQSFLEKTSSGAGRADDALASHTSLSLFPQKHAAAEEHMGSSSASKRGRSCKVLLQPFGVV